MHTVSPYASPIDSPETNEVAPAGGGTLALKLQRKYPDRVTGAFTLPAREGRYAPFPTDLPPQLADALRARGLSRLYSHQADAWEATRRGEDIVVVTLTASGKTLCYTLPVIAEAIHDRSKALYLFPTKALAQDQVAELLELNKAGGLGICAATFDGDTPGDQRQTYIDATNASITRALRGLATVRRTDTAALGDASKAINAWCAEAGQGDPREHQELSDRQEALLDRLATVSRVCAMPPGTSAPAANRAIHTCRTQPDPQPAPPEPPRHGDPSGQGSGKEDGSSGSDHRPIGYANGTGEPHYRLPSGQTLSTQRAGEFWLLDSPDGTRVQVRQVPWRGSRQVAAIGAIAAQVRPHRVGIYVDGRVMVDGKALAWSGRVHQQSLGNDAVVGMWGTAGAAVAGCPHVAQRSDPAGAESPRLL